MSRILSLLAIICFIFASCSKSNCSKSKEEFDAACKDFKVTTDASVLSSTGQKILAAAADYTLHGCGSPLECPCKKARDAYDTACNEYKAITDSTLIDAAADKLATAAAQYANNGCAGTLSCQ